MPKLSLLCVTAGLLCSVAFLPVLAADGVKPAAHQKAAKGAIPDFNPDGFTAWAADRPASDDYLPHDKTTGPGPVESDPKFPYVPNGEGRQSTYRIADLTNPILKPWVKELMKAANDDVHAGKVPFIARERCWPGGMPSFLLYPIQPLYFIQTPKEVLLILQYDHQIRRVLLDQKHSANPKPSWFGESVGQYEGDTLVVDTIGITTKATVDNYQTPHTEALHVVERYRIIGGGKQLQVDVTVDDPGAFTTAWSARQLYNRADQEMIESICAENNGAYFSYDVAPVPEAKQADF